MKGRVLCPAFAHSVVVRKSAGVRLRFENYFFSPQPQFFHRNLIDTSLMAASFEFGVQKISTISRAVSVLMNRAGMVQTLALLWRRANDAISGSQQGRLGFPDVCSASS